MGILSELYDQTRMCTTKDNKEELKDNDKEVKNTEKESSCEEDK